MTSPPTHTHAAIVSIGDELSLGQNLDTNSRWIAEQLSILGIMTLEHVTIGDDQADTARTFARLAERTGLVISTGGLGPTLDDLTRQALADILGEPLITDTDALRDLEARFASRGRTLSEIQKIQACRPASARMIPNPNGTAPGVHAVVPTPRSTFPHADIFCLPGPPSEMKPMFAASVVPALRPAPGRTVRVRFIHMTGIGEGDAAAALGPLMDRERVPLVGITASGGVLTCRIRYEGPLPPDAVDALIEETAVEIRRAIGPHIFGEGGLSLVGAILNELVSRAATLATVESCTGGMLGQLITDVAGSSAAYVGGFVSYANEFKTELVGVDPVTIAQHGAVSEATAREMALGGLRLTGASYALSITGVAGPGGGTAMKPVGTVFIGLASRATPDQTVVRRFFMPGPRDDVRRRAVTSALSMLLFTLRNPEARMRLLWEQGN